MNFIFCAINFRMWICSNLDSRSTYIRISSKIIKLFKQLVITNWMSATELLDYCFVQETCWPNERNGCKNFYNQRCVECDFSYSVIYCMKTRINDAIDERIREVIYVEKVPIPFQYIYHGESVAKAIVIWLWLQLIKLKFLIVRRNWNCPQRVTHD